MHRNCKTRGGDKKPRNSICAVFITTISLFSIALFCISVCKLALTGVAPLQRLVNLMSRQLPAAAASAQRGKHLLCSLLIRPSRQSRKFFKITMLDYIGLKAAELNLGPSFLVLACALVVSILVILAKTKLRKRDAAKAVQCTEDASDSYDSSSESSYEDDYEPGQKSRHKATPRGRNKKRKKPAPSRAKKPELLELALHHMDIRSCLDEETKKSLRLTSKKCRELVEDARALAGFQTWCGSDTFNETFTAFLESPRSIQRVESIFIHGKISIAQTKKFILRAPPRLKKLFLNKNFDGIEALLCGDFPQLTSFILHDCSKGEACNLLAETTWPLQELELVYLEPLRDNLADILNNYPELTRLELGYIRYSGALSEQRFENGLKKLEVLEISGRYCNDYLKHHLFHENLQLPSLHTLIYESSWDTMQHALSIRCSWMKQLRSLTMGNWYTDTKMPLNTFRALMAILEGGPLESLKLRVVDNFTNSWDFISLPNLTKFVIEVSLTGRAEDIDFFNVVSSPHLPMLKEAKIRTRKELHYRGYPSLPSNGVDISAQAYPHLKSLSLTWNEDAVVVSPTVVGEIFTHILPYVEEFTLDCCKFKHANVCPAIFGIDEVSGVKWPRLQKLTLSLTAGIEYWNDNDAYPLSVLQQLAAAAHHCPNLRELDVNTRNEEQLSEMIKSISEILNEAQAWPLMQRFECGKYYNLWYQNLKNLWPNAELVRS